jgi:hypothetical protein
MIEAAGGAKVIRYSVEMVPNLRLTSDYASILLGWKRRRSWRRNE